MRIRTPRSKLILLFMAFAMVLALPATAFADTLKDDVVGDVTNGTRTITAGGSTTVSYHIQPNGPDGCNVDASNAATVTINKPAGVSSDKSQLIFTKCKESGNNENSQSVTFSSNTANADGYAITTSVSGGKAGNNGWNTDDAGFKLIVNAITPSDTTAPNISKGVTPASPDGLNGWYTTNVSVDWTVADNESSISSQSGCDDFSVTSDQNSTTYTCSATSAGGTSNDSVTIKRDATAPQISGANVNDTTWRNSNLSQSFTASDAMSGLSNGADASFNLTASAESANANTPTTDSKTVTDAAGNSATRSLSALIDKTAPTLNPSVSPNPVLLNGSATATSGAQDNLSGVESEGCDPVNTSSVGAKSVSCSATDEAGNQRSASASYNVNYRFAGFRAPVDNGGIFNSVKAGQSVPMKFSLSGNQGLSIIETGSPKVAAVTCPNSATMVDQIEETTTANSGLTYDATADQYNYVWKTQSTYAGKCFRFDMKLIDGTTQSALFKFTK